MNSGHVMRGSLAKTNVVNFPKPFRRRAATEPDKPAPEALNVHAKKKSPGAVRALWVLVVLVWPLLKWVIALDVLFQFGRMAYFWNTPGTYAGLAFLLHFAAFTAVTYFVSLYKPEGI